jgi:hypothetical protein
LGSLRLRDDASPFVDEHTAGGRQLNATLRAIEQRDTELAFHPLDLLRQARLRDAEPLSGAPEVEVVGEGEKGAKLSQLDHHDSLSKVPEVRIGLIDESRLRSRETTTDDERMLLLKLLLTPLIIIAVTLIARRWGPRAAGLLVGLPVTGGPVSVFLATEHGRLFAARAASGAIAGTLGTAGFCAAFALIARRHRTTAALGGGLVALGAITAAMHALRAFAPPFIIGALLAVAALAGMWVMVSELTRRESTRARSPHPARDDARMSPRWDLAMRATITTTIVAAVTTGAGVLGANWSGVLGSLPVMGAVLGVFTHRDDGSAASIALMRGLIIGCISTILFFAVVGTMVLSHHLLPAYAAAAVVAIGSGAIVSATTIWFRGGHPLTPYTAPGVTSSGSG